MFADVAVSPISITVAPPDTSNPLISIRPLLTVIIELRLEAASELTEVVRLLILRFAESETSKRVLEEFALAEFILVEAAVEEEKGNLDSSIFRLPEIFFVPLIVIGK